MDLEIHQWMLKLVKVRLWWTLRYLHNLKEAALTLVTNYKGRNTNFIERIPEEHDHTQVIKANITGVGTNQIVSLLIPFAETHRAVFLWFSAKDAQPESNHKEKLDKPKLRHIVQNNWPCSLTTSRSRMTKKEYYLVPGRKRLKTHDQTWYYIGYGTWKKSS